MRKICNKKRFYSFEGSTGEICYHLYDDKCKVPVDAVEDHFRQGPFVDGPVHKKKLL